MNGTEHSQSQTSLQIGHCFQFTVGLACVNLLNGVVNKPSGRYDAINASAAGLDRSGGHPTRPDGVCLALMGSGFHGYQSNPRIMTNSCCVNGVGIQTLQGIINAIFMSKDCNYSPR